MEAPCTCGHPAGQHANGGQCRAGGRWDDRCDCQSLDIDDESSE